jgi:Zn-dependent protease
MNEVVIAVLERALFVLPLWISLSVHEWAHARAAFALGDDTAEKMGRMTLDPLAHVDWVGTVLLPLLGIPFGWAKPVPVQTTHFSKNVSMTTGLLLVALAGPLSNLALALIVLGLEAVLARFVPDLAGDHPLLGRVLDYALATNVMLALFNLLPFGPLDGSRVVEGLVPFERRALWDRVGPSIGIALLVVFFFVGAPLVLGEVRAMRDDLHAWIAG